MPQRRFVEDDLDDEVIDPPAGTGHRRRTMRDYLQWLLRRWWVIALTTTVGLVLGLYVFNRTPKKYASQVTIEIERQGIDAQLDENDQELRLTGDAFINTVAQKLKLPKYYLALAEEQALHERPDILPERFAFFAKDDPNRGAPIPGLTPDRLAGIMPGWVSTNPMNGSTLMTISVEHTSPVITQIVANGVVEAYQKVSETEKRDESGQTVEQVEQELNTLRTTMSVLAKRKARYADCLKTKELIDQKDSEIAEKSGRWGPKWPRMIELKTQRKQQEEKFRRELEVVKSGDEEERAYWEDLEKNAVDPLGELQPRVTLLENEMKTAELRLVNRQQTLTQAQLDATDANEFSRQRAAGPGYLVGPKRGPVVAKFTFAGAALGVGLVLMLGFLDQSARTVPDLEGLFDLPILGAIPIDKNVPRRKKGGHRPTPTLLTDHSPPAEAIRNLRAGLSFLGNRGDRRSFLLTSSVPGEGKSWISANLAVAFGAQGDRTLIIDLDLRKPTQHLIFGIDRGPGVSDFLTQDTPLQNIFHATAHDNVYLIPAGTRSPNPSELITPKNLRLLLERIPKEIDRIIIDTSPVLAVRDALGPAKMVDSTIVVFKMAKTPVKALDRLLTVMDENHTWPVGIIANALPNSKRKGYGYYGDYYYGYHGYGEYYGEESEDEDGGGVKKRKKRQEP